MGGVAKDVFVRGIGCNYCSDTGYRERVGVYEVLGISDEVRKIVVAGGTPQEVRQVAIEQGMRTMGNEAAALVADDVTTIDEIRRTVYVS